MNMQSTLANAIHTVNSEITESLHSVSEETLLEISTFMSDTETRWFFSGQGRSGLVANMIAMRFMHLGLKCHVIGEATAPSVTNKDVLVLFSKTGNTNATISFATIAKNSGARILAVTSNHDSELTRIADISLIIADGKSEQFAGSRFEQSALLALDALVLANATQSTGAYGQMAARHTNMQ